jgi:hypothetical protein
MRVFLLPKPENVNLSGVYTTDLYPKPLNTIGYNYFQVQTNDSIFKLLLAPENIGKKFYYIMENLTSDINYENNIDTISTKYFGESVDTEFLQLWEMILAFDLIDKRTSVSTNNPVLSQVFNKLKKFVKIDVKEKEKKTHLCMLNSVQFDTTELEISKKITKFLEELETLEEKGCLIIKIKELIHAPSAHLLYLLSYLFEDVYIHRPDLSFISRGERYIVCKNYQGKNNKLKYDLKKDYLTLNINLPTEFIFTLNVINRVLMQEEYIVRNKMRNFINSQNYFGDEYHSQLAIQQNSTDKWIATNFMITSKDYNELIKQKEKELNTSIEVFESLIENKMKVIL